MTIPRGLRVGDCHKPLSILQNFERKGYTIHKAKPRVLWKPTLMKEAQKKTHHALLGSFNNIVHHHNNSKYLYTRLCLCMLTFGTPKIGFKRVPFPQGAQSIGKPKRYVLALLEQCPDPQDCEVQILHADKPLNCGDASLPAKVDQQTSRNLTCDDWAVRYER